MKKRLTLKPIMLCMALVVLALAFTACRDQGGNEDAPTTTTTTTTAPATPTTAPATTAPTTTEPPAPVATFPDLGGRVIRISTTERGAFGFMGPLHPEENLFIDADPEAAHYHRLSMQIENRRRVEELFNIVIEPIHTPGGQVVNRIREEAMAGQLFADIAEGALGQALTASISGYIHPLDVLAAQLEAQVQGVYLSFRNSQETAWPWLINDGHIWNIGRPLPPMSNWGLHVNMALIESMGAPNPIELYERGQWNWDTMREIMEIVTQDTTGDGEIDTFGMSGNMHDLIRNLIIANDAYLIDPDTLTLGHLTPAGMEAMEFVYEILTNWWTPGDPGHASPARGGGHNDQTFGQGRTAFGFGFPGIQRTFVEAGFEGTIEWLPLPPGPRNTSGVTTNSLGRNGVMILEGAEDPHYLLWILSELYAWPGDEWYELEYTFDQDWARGFMANEDAVQRLFNLAVNGMRLDIGNFVGGLGGMHNNMVEAWWNGEMTVAQSLEHWRAEREADINSFFGIE